MDKWNEEKAPLNYERAEGDGLGDALETLMRMTYRSSCRIDATFKGEEITFITNENGEPITLFIGERNEKGDISGEMFSRRVRKLQNGLIRESHWHCQGKVL